MSRIVLLDCGSGNLHSLARALSRVATGQVVISNRPEALETATHLVVPGQGHFGRFMESLHREPGLLSALTRRVLVDKMPFLGICVGMQILATTGEEARNTALPEGSSFSSGSFSGLTPGLDWVSGCARRLRVGGLRLPHMGWNQVGSPTGTRPPRYFYFAHSYCLDLETPPPQSAWCAYGESFLAGFELANIAAVQFHPEKSQLEGLRLLADFVHRRPLFGEASLYAPGYASGYTPGAGRTAAAGSAAGFASP